MRPLKQYSYVHEEAKKIVNGQVVEDKMMNAEYNGKILNVDERNNNKVHHYTLDNKHIKQLLAQKTSTVNLLDRLHMDYTKRRHHLKKKATRKAATRKAATRKAATRKAATRKAATRKAATRKIKSNNRF